MPKRRLRFTEDLEVGSNIKCPKVSEGRNTSENTDKTDRKKDCYEHTRINRSEVGVNISKCAGGWHGGKKTPPKISKSPGLKVGKAQEKISTPKGRKFTKKRGGLTGHEDKNQHSITKFIVSSPRTNRIGGSILDEDGKEQGSSEGMCRNGQ